MESVGEHGGLDLSTSKPLSDVLNGYTYFRDGDVLVAKITPCFENGKGALAKSLTSGLGFGTTELHVLRPTEKLDAGFLFYVTMSDRFRKLGKSRMYGAGGQKRISEDFVEEFRLALPPFAIQQAIASFLDRETGKIDTLIEKKQRLLDLLEEKRAALITRAVTRGLDPDVSMKDTGVEWLGEIPEHWEVCALKHVTRLKSGSFLSSDEIRRAGKYPVYGANGVRGYTNDFTHEGETALVGRQGALSGNVNYALGKFWATEHAIVLTPDAGIVVRWLGELVRAMNLNQYAEAAAQPGLAVSDVGSFRIPLPPKREQTWIARHIEQEFARDSNVKNKIERAISLLQEYRTALISAAVTGKIDVRDRVPA